MLKLLWRCLLAAVALIAAAVLLYQIWILGHIWYWVDHNPGTSAFMLSRLEDLQSKKPQTELKHQWIAYDRLSVHLKRAIIAAEDARFLEHEGFDWESIQKAYEKNLKKGKIVAGGSTISQQLAKNLFLSGRRSPWRKAEEAVITLMLEKMMDKQRILEIYLNIIEWGDGVFGAEAAARHYFGVSASALNREQAARLAAIVPNPRFYDKNRNTRWLNRKTEMLLRNMEWTQVP
ncbi:MAG: monofunctional biosynthetic peptidoglycan transglycosylase [Burkholderiales bacterium]